MGWKFGTIGFGLTTVGFAVLSSLIMIWAFELEGERKVEKAKREGLETIVDIQGGLLSNK